MNELQVFTHPEFGTFSAIEIDGKPYFPATKSAAILGYKNPQEAIRDHCKGVSETLTMVQTGTKADGSPALRETSIRIIPEGDLYRLIVRSNLATAEKFERWVFDEVIPSIRKHGAYMTPQALAEALQNPAGLIQVLTALQEEQERNKALQAQIEQDAPLVLFSKSVSVSDDAVLIRELSKILKQNGVDIGQNRLYAWLRDNGYLIKAQGKDYNTPTQRAMELGLFRVKETAVTCADGRIFAKPTTMVTGKGQVYFVNKFLSEQAAVPAPA